MENNRKNKPHFGPRGMGVADKPKDFSKTLKRLIKYIGGYNKSIIVVVVVLIISTIYT